jgi:hypothetical protein
MLKAITQLPILPGKCVSHEIDVLIKKDNALEMVECKFHSAEKISLTSKFLVCFSRFNDLKKESRSSSQKRNDFKMLDSN